MIQEPFAACHICFQQLFKVLYRGKLEVGTAITPLSGKKPGATPTYHIVANCFCACLGFKGGFQDLDGTFAFDRVEMCPRRCFEETRFVKGKICSKTGSTWMELCKLPQSSCFFTAHSVVSANTRQPPLILQGEHPPIRRHAHLSLCASHTSRKGHLTAPHCTLHCAK